jgi:cytochrome c
VLPDERVLFIERRGNVKLYLPRMNEVKVLGRIPVQLKYTNGDQAEDGLLGLAIDPGFARNGWVYMYYSPEGLQPRNVLSRFRMVGDSLDLRSEHQMLEVAVQRATCCHTGGSIAFDARGNLYLSTGDNSNPFANGYAPIDERPDRTPWDAQRSSGNTNDLRGKILRIHPEPDGSYTIPDGNLFPRGTPNTRPEIYTMGHRNPYRIAVDRRTGFVYWGDVGPDANVDSVGKGPAGHDEIGQARSAGNFGWPHFVADNKAYWDIDYATGHVGAQFDAARPVNASPNNTGLRELPPAQKAFIWYPYGASAEFPLMGTGGRTAMAGPVFHAGDFANAARAYPAWYDGKLFTYEWMRGVVMAVTMDSAGNYVAMERFMPSHKFSNPVDMEFGPGGDLYVLEYGTGWFQGNEDARLVRIEYNAGNRAPTVVASVSRAAAALPMTVRLSADGTSDADDDSLAYAWTVTRANGDVVRRLRGRNPALTLAAPGTYAATLRVTDAQGAFGEKSVRILAGNEPPRVSIVPAGSRTFFFPGVPIRYAVRVSDREDGSLAGGGIDASRVRVTADFLAEAPAAGANGAGSPHEEAIRLIEANNCLACHQFDRTSIGPSYRRVADRYATDTTATTRLVQKVMRGGRGVWGEVNMPAHPKLSEREATLIVGYIRGLAAANDKASLPATGEYSPPDSAARLPTGVVALRAQYTDRGAVGLPGIAAETTLVLRNATVVLATGALSEGISKMKVDNVPVELTIVNRPGASVALKHIDLTGVAALTISVSAPAQYGAQGGTIEVRADSATGTLLGATDAIAPQPGTGSPVQKRVTLAPVSGTKDLYLVVRNEAAKPDQMLLVLVTGTFEPR